MASRLRASVVLLLSIMTTGPLSRASQGSTAADMSEVRAYRLTMPKVTSFYATIVNLRKLAAAYPELCAAVDPTETDEAVSLSERAKQIEASHPEVVPVLAAEGLSAREFLVMAMAQLQAGMAVYAKSMGAKELPAEVSPENVAFMEQNKEQLDAMQANLDKIPDPCEDAGDPYDDEGEDTEYDEE